MQFNILDQFRHDVYLCFRKAQDALFETCDALLTEPTARTFAELSLSPRFTRQWPSLYAALKDGCIDQAALQWVFAQYAPMPSTGQRLLLGVDGTGIARPESPTAKDRTYLYVHNLPKSAVPVTIGWSFSSLVVLLETTSSWTYVLDNQRIPSQTTAAQLAADQLGQVVPHLPVRAVLVADRYYGSAKFVAASAMVSCDKLLRIPSNRVFYRPAPRRRPRRRGAPKKDGHPFKCKDARTWGKPSATWQGLDEHGHAVEVAAWSGLHYKQCRAVSLAVLRVIRQGATGKKRDPRVSWFVWIGGELIALDQVWKTYRRRYGHDHGFRYDKQDLLWLEPHVRTPEQFQRWTDVVAAGRNQLVLARPEAEVQRQPWESQSRPVTPRQARRSMGRILAALGTPAQRPQPRGKSPGRRPGATIQPAPRYKVVYKGKPCKTRPRKRA
ncbi:MAG: transposase [Chloroflexi bacterium]|nr:transposase [Chloroflexota bacterium]